MKKILIIEDDQLVANIYRNKFSVDGYKVEVALDGETGFEQIKTLQPDLIILDLMLPKITGVELLKKIRAQTDLRQLPVVVFSNTYLTSLVQDAWKAGATKCLSKANCTPKQLMEVVRSLMSVSSAAVPAGGSVTSALSLNDAPVATTEAEPKADSDAAFQAELWRSFIESLPGTLAAIRATLQILIKTTDEPGRVKQLQELYRKVHALTSNAGLAGAMRIAQMADALEALLKELYEKPRNITASTLRTAALAVDFLGVLFEPANLPETQKAQAPLQGTVLVVDDEAISQRAVGYALEKAKLRSVKVADANTALDLLATKSFDLIFLDVDMPEMNGFELCAKLRRLRQHEKTPVVFVTSLTDFESRANSTMSGGNDLIAKPFVFMELAVKALVYVMRGKLAQPRAVGGR